MKRDNYLLDFIYTEHVGRRSNQRGIRRKDIEYAIKHGRKIYKYGGICFFVGKKEVDREHDKLNGLHVIIEDNAIVTAYKNRIPNF